MSLCEAFVCSYSLVHASFEAIDILLREVINGHSLIDRSWQTVWHYGFSSGKIRLL